MTVVMFDSVDPSTVPTDAVAVAGYTAGSWPTFYNFEKEFPTLVKQHRVVSIAVQDYDNGRFLDVESGDATPSQAPGWFKSSHVDHSDGKPGIYGSASSVQTIINTLSGAGIPRSDYLIWSAHYNGREHICSPSECGYPQADLTQWTSNALGRNLDQSLCQDYVFEALAPKYPIWRFVDTNFQQPWEWHYHPKLSGFKWINERKTVEAYLAVKDFPNKYPTKIALLEQQLLFLRKRIWYVANTQRDKHGKATWGTDWRGWRYTQLYEWTKNTKAWWTRYYRP